MAKEQRKSARRHPPLRAFLYTSDGWPLGECKLQDISVTGARLADLPEDEIPEQFLLSLSHDGKVRRRCQTKWRTDEEIGVQFHLSTE